LRACSKALFV
jgi:hypothetical protein